MKRFSQFSPYLVLFALLSPLRFSAGVSIRAVGEVFMLRDCSGRHLPDLGIYRHFEFGAWRLFRIGCLLHGHVLKDRGFAVRYT